MSDSVFTLFRIGVGPSSSHTMGPMTAAARFIDELRSAGQLERTELVQVTLFGSLALTGRGHATDRAVMLGLAGHRPETLDPDQADACLAGIRDGGALLLAGAQIIAFDEATDIVWEPRRRLPQHPNALTFTASGRRGPLRTLTCFSLGGGSVFTEAEMGSNLRSASRCPGPYPFASGAALLSSCRESGLSIAGVMRANEAALRPDAETDAGLDDIWRAMLACMDRGLTAGGVLPGGLCVPRRARALHERLRAGDCAADPLGALAWVHLWALAVSEENAAGGRMVTAPTNGAAGLLPAVLRYYCEFHQGTEAGRRDFLLTAGAIGSLYRRNASISGAEVGCQGEVGVACSMAAAGLAAALGGTPEQVENAAEIGMEHNLGLTCDPIGGLVQIPCIERNAMGAAKAIEAARLALLGGGDHVVSLDQVIATMKRTGEDMNEIYKETSLGGLAVSFPEC